MHNRLMQPLRIAIQFGFLGFQIYLGLQLFRFVSSVSSTGIPAVARPDGIEGFLPIAALLGVKDWVVTGSINRVHPASVVIFVTIVALAFLLKRSFCSWICPIGTLSEMLWKSGFNRFRRNLRLPKGFDVAVRGVKYALMLVFLYSILYAMSAQEVTAFIHSDYSKIADVRLLQFFLHLSLGGIAFILFFLLLSIPLRNPFCRFLCPYGALLGLVSVFSPAKITRDREICISCGVCSQVCPSHIDVMKKERVMSPECIGCWRCVSHCRAPGALAMKLTGGRIAVSGILFSILVVGIFWGGSFIGKLTGNWHTGISTEEYAGLLRGTGKQQRGN